MNLTTPALSGPNAPPSTDTGESPAQHREDTAPSRRRICFVLDSLNVGGTETQAVELALRLDPAEYAVTLACLRVKGPLQERLLGSAVRLMEFHPEGGMNSPGGIYQLLRLAAFLRRQDFHILHAHDLWANLLAVPAAKLARVPVIISSQRDLSHLDFYSTKRKKWLRMLQKGSTAVVTNARSIRDGLVNHERFASSKVRVIYNGVDMDRFAQAKPNRALFNQVPDIGKVIVLVGNMHTDVKGHPTLIAAASGVVQEFPDTRFVMVGDGAMRPSLEQKVSELGLGENFLFLGRRNDVPQILASSDIAVLPSKAEGLPNAVLEYLAAGLPTIASNVGGNAEVLENEQTGMLVPSGSVEALAEALLRVLRDPALAHRLGTNGQQAVRERFSFERLIQAMGAMYSELLAARGVNA